MPVPTQAAIKHAFASLQNGLPLIQRDIFNIAWDLTFHPNQDELLKEIHPHNKKLAETLLIFRKRLREAAAASGLEPAIDQLCLHYMINTDGAIPELERDDPFDVFEAATRYANALCVDLRKGADNASILRLNEKDVVCPEWGPEPGWSAASSLRQIGPVINRARYGRDDVIPSAAFGFDENADRYTLPNAMTLADFAHLAYFEPAYVEKQVKSWGYGTFRWVQDESSDTQAFAAGKDGHVVVCFRGTSSGTDALVDASFRKTDAFGGRGRVHGGFQRALEGVWPLLLAAVTDLGTGKKMFVCGHSLGAALAQLAAHRFVLSGRPVTGVYVYGSPRVGNGAFMEAYNELLKAKTFLHINHQDIVTHMPPELFGFHHLGGSPRVFNERHDISMGDAEQADAAQEKRFEDLNATEQAAIQQQIEEVQMSIAASTRFLRTAPQQFSGGSYSTSFETGAADDHSMDQYLFKLGCAIVDSEWKRLGT